MTKKEMLENLDICMMVQLESAIRCADNGLDYSANCNLETASGILLSARRLNVINDKEFENINHCLSYTNLRWCR